MGGSTELRARGRMTRGTSPSLSFDALAATEAQLDVLDDRFMNLLVHTDVLVAEGYEVTSDTKHTLLRGSRSCAG
jgi:hypothetical protein